MTTRIDHAAESERIAEHLGESVIAIEGITDATIIATQLDSLRHAVLALVDQRRTANFIAYVQLLEAQYAEAARNEAEFDWQTRADSEFRHGIALDRIREGLGL